MKSLFELAQFYKEQFNKRGDFPKTHDILYHAAIQTIGGYLSLDEAYEETNTRYDAWGNEIECGVVIDAVNYLRNYHPQVTKVPYLNKSPKNKN